MRFTFPAAAAACVGLGLAFVGPAQAMVAVPGMAAASAAPAITKVEYFCSPGFEPSYGGTCLAVPSRAEVEIYVEQPIYETSEVVRHTPRRHHRHGMRERY